MSQLAETLIQEWTKRSRRALGGTATFALVMLVGAIILLGAQEVVSDGTLALSDHPDRLARVDFAYRMLRSGLDPFGWEPYIMGGSPDLQFYPPGHALLGAAFAFLTGGDVLEAYRILVTLALILPALTVPLLLRALGVSAAVSAASGGIAASLAFGQSGTLVGVGYGVLGSRFSLGIAPLVVLCFVKIARSQRVRGGWTIALALSCAAQILMHPYHLPATLVVAAVATAGRRTPAPHRFAAWIVTAAGVSIAGIWWTGLVLMRSTTVPFLWGDTGKYLSFLAATHGVGLGALAAGAGASFAVGMVLRGDRRFAVARALLPVALLVALVALVLVKGFRVEYFDPLRLLDDVFFWSAAGSLLWVEALSLRKAWVAVRLVAVAVLTAGWFAVEASMLQPESVFSSNLSDFEKGPPGAVWQRLATGHGRVLFTSTAYNGSHIFGLTGVKAQREFLGGTSTHPSPNQAFLLYGPRARTVRDLADDFDDRSVLGVDWNRAARTDAEARTLWSRLVDLGVTQVVTGADAPFAPERAMQDHPDLFSAPEFVAGFLLFDVVGATPGRIAPLDEYTVVSIAHTSRTSTDAVVRTTNGGGVVLRVPNTGYWQATVDGEAVTAASDEFGQMTVAVPPGTHRVSATYRLPTKVVATRGASVLAGLALLLAIHIGRRRRSERTTIIGASGTA